MKVSTGRVDVQLEIDISDDSVIDALAEMLLSLAKGKEQNDG
jgi:hypothetical protein